jgi:hypothetical protein
LNRVVHHTERLIAARNYARLPRENGELKEAMEALEKSIAKEPMAFRHVVEPLMNQVRVDSQGIADASTLRDEAKLSTAHAALAGSVKAVIAAFPANVQPAPVDVTTRNSADRAGTRHTNSYVRLFNDRQRPLRFHASFLRVPQQSTQKDSFLAAAR